MTYELSPKMGMQISGTFEMRDKDGNLIKAVPFTTTAPLEVLSAVPQPQEEPQNGDHLGE